MNQMAGKPLNKITATDKPILLAWDNGLLSKESRVKNKPAYFKDFVFYSPNKKQNAGINTIAKSFLIKGESLSVMQSLRNAFLEKVKLIYIDPPYNTGNNSFGYNDSFGHSQWLELMRQRLIAARDFLSSDGCIMIQIDNSPSTNNESPELGYLLVLMDEVFGRKNYVTTFTWQKKGNPGNTEKGIGTITESIILYAKDKACFKPNHQAYERNYKYKDGGKEYNLEFPVKTNEGTYERKTMQFGIKTPEGIFYPPKGKRWTIGEAMAKKIVAEKKYRIEGGKFKIMKEAQDYKRGNGKLYNNLLTGHGSLKAAKDELLKLGFEREKFGSPKPEALMKALIEMVTNTGDMVMDFFAGSGTTAAVAHKLNRNFITIEQENFADTITVSRLQKVLNGDAGGISKEVKWKGGGSFLFCKTTQNRKAISKTEAELNKKYFNLQ